MTHTSISRLHHVVLDAREPAALAGFSSRLLGLRVTYSSDWAVIAAHDTSSGIAFISRPNTCRRPGPTRPDRSSSTST